ncbi:single-stranded-DNA-specific exonuclease RecJ [Holospora undulata]|uniref:Single-stranded-DNA-specific exonuclease RecJ n=1 Tax=Holospora undulata HU1 TaxID=1321371 RepID=A0A061JFW2_9PROT|nr:single-stranded-DNA-specific exonuclease RecJ [Holospora undulata]ETZ04646.1 single-stranded-DNA-specific exonuclease RecJ [Holospora undulata HU1]
MTPPFSSFALRVHKNTVPFSHTGRDWHFLSACERHVAYLKERYQVNDLAARLVANRSIMEEAEEIFSPFLRTHLPDPSHLPDLLKAVEHLEEVIREKRPLAVWGDYDVDGACASALIVKYCNALNHPVISYIPNRFQEGYGPNIHGFQMLQNTHQIHDLIVVDCGSTSFEVMAAAREQKMRVTIIDHHQVPGIDHPECVAFINPKRLNYTGPESLKTLCAGGLVFLFLVGANRYFRKTGMFSFLNTSEPDLFSLLDLVALSTVCDMMPLRGINRVFVKQGLKVLGQRKNVGLTQLLDVSGIREEPNAIHLGYALGPRINAGGRVGNSTLGVQLIATDSVTKALEIAQELNALNQERQHIERATEQLALAQALKQQQQHYLFLWDSSWHEGVLGIIAGHLKEIFGKPTFVLSEKNGMLKGSSRSVSGIDIGRLIHQACEEGVLVTGGGHPMAGGLTLRFDQISPFRTFLDKSFKNCYPEKNLSPMKVDMVVTLAQLNQPNFLDVWEKVGPFGADYPSPIFMVKRIYVQHATAFGHNHLRLKVCAEEDPSILYSVVCFRITDKPAGPFLLSLPKDPIDVLLTIQISRKWGKRFPNFVLEDFRCP